MSVNTKLVHAALRSDIGQVRQVNQDFVDQREPAGAEGAARDGWVYILADGAGGMDAGELASRYATERVLHHYLQAEDIDWGERLSQAIQSANSDLRTLGARRNGGSRMATTMVVVAIHDKLAEIANVGDSRAYHWRQGDLHQVTKDQSLVAKLVEEGAISEEEAAVHPRRHILLYSIGSDRTPQIDLYQQPLEPEDLLLLCSDGLTRHVADYEIAMLLGQNSILEKAAEKLIDLANKRGGQDNISVVILRYLGELGATAEIDAVLAEPVVSTPARRFLWFFTILLSLIQTILIFLAWLATRV